MNGEEDERGLHGSNFALPDMYLTRELDLFWVMEERGEKRAISSGSTTLEAIAPVYECFCQLLGIDPWS